MNQHFKEGPPEAEGAEEDADSKIEQAVEEPVEEEDYYQYQRNVESEVVQNTGDEQISFSLFV